MAFKNVCDSKRQFPDSEASEEEIEANGFHKEDENSSSIEDEPEDSEMEQDIDDEDENDDDDDSDVEVGSTSQDEAETGSDDERFSDMSEEIGCGKESSLTPAADDFEKAKSVTSQLRFWEHLLKMRVNLQKAMVIINQLPQCERLHELVSEAGKPCQQNLANGRGCLKRLLDQLFEIETVVLTANPETKHLVTGDTEPASDGKSTTLDDDDEEITSESEAGSESEKDEEEASFQNQQHTFKRSQYPQLISKRHKAYEKYRNSTIQKWADKTQSLSKFAAFDQSIAKQIQQTLTDKSRLVARTRVNRLGNRVLGKASPIVEAPAAETDTAVVSAAAIDQDEEIFDDNDFYHHILREFIQYKNSYDPIVLTKQWLEIQQYRKKAKKNVDRKASKGRKTRYNVHKPLMNFMAPINSPDLWTNDQRDDLFKNLFGKALSGAM